MIYDWMQDLRFSLRVLAKRPAFTAVALLTLALGIGANTAVFSVLKAVLLAPLPHPQAEELVVVWQTDRHNGTQREGASVPDLEDWRSRADAFEGLGAWRSLSFNLHGTGGGAGSEPERLRAAGVSHELLPLLRAEPALGSTFTAEDDKVGAEPVVLLSHGLWQRRFAGEASAVGSTVRLDDVSYRVLGVLPEGFAFPNEQDLWVPLAPQVTQFAEFRGAHVVLVLGRLAPGRSVTQAQEQMASIASQLEQEYPDDNVARGAFVEPLREVVVGSVRTPLLLLFGTAALVLLIACANVANLALARVQGRSGEIAVRTALGAGRRRLLGQLLTENTVLALAGGGLGILLALWSLDSLVALIPESVPRAAEIRIDGPIFAFAFLASLASVAIFGAFPALQAARLGAGGGLRSSERDGGTPGGYRGRRRRPQSALVVAEVTLATVLLVGAGLLVRSFWTLSQVDPGFAPERLLTLGVQLPEARYPPPSREDFPHFPTATAFYTQLQERLEATPGVASAGLALNGPLSAGWTTSFTIDGQLQSAAEGSGEGRDELRLRPIGPGYLKTVGVPLLQGRDLEARDTGTAAPVLLVNQEMARRYFPDRSPLGESLTFWGASREIVGVVGDVRFRGLEREPQPAMYPPLAQVPMSEVKVLLRTAGDPLATLPAARNAVWEIDPGLAIYEVDAMDAILFQRASQPRFNALLMSLLAGLALVLSVVGVYGVLSYGVAERTREIGIRMALGAPRSQVLASVVRQGLGLTALAVILGLGLVLALGRVLQSLLFEVTARDPWTFVATAGCLLVAGAVAAYLPARRASRVDPMIALRHD